VTTPPVGVLDTSVLIDLAFIDPDQLPAASAVTAVTAVIMAELAAGPHATEDPVERAVRQQRAQWAESAFTPLPFDAACARQYGLLYAAVRDAGRQPCRRFVDLLIAATAIGHQLPLFTRNPGDFSGLHRYLSVRAV